jgi:hypothetical protein
MRVYACGCTNIHIHMHTHINTHTHTRALWSVGAYSAVAMAPVSAAGLPHAPRVTNHMDDAAADGHEQLEWVWWCGVAGSVVGSG